METPAPASVSPETTVPDNDPIVVPVVAEELTATTHPVDRGAVHVTTRVETVPAPWETTLREDEVDVARVPVNQLVEVAPEPRWEGETLIVPVLAEEVVVTRLLILREEVRITRRTHPEVVTGTEPVRRQLVDVERVPPAEPRPDDAPSARTDQASPSA
jgi:stress response protein YsnF